MSGGSDDSGRCHICAMKTNGRIQLYPVLRIAVFFAAGIIVGERCYGVLPATVWLSALVVALVAAFALRRRAVAQTVAVFSACVMLGGCLAAVALSRVDVSLPEGDVAYSAVVVSRPVAVGKVVRCDLMITDSRRPVKVKASFYRDDRAERLRAGSGVRAVSVLERPCNYDGGTFDYRRYLLYHGFSATTFLYINDWHEAVISLERLSYAGRVKIAALSVRETLLGRLRDMGIDGNAYAVLAAMTLGERVAMPDELGDDYSVSGALHVLSLSGLHLSIVYAMLSLLFFGRCRRLPAFVCVIGAVWTYVFIAGLPVSAVRSAVMLTVYSLVGLLNRERLPLNALAVAAVAVLVVSPLDFYDVSFQMSFVSVLAIVLLYLPIYRLVPRRVSAKPVVGWVWGMTAVSLAAQIGVAPLVAFYFGRFSCYFLLANFVAVPAAAAVLYGVVLMAVMWWLPSVQDLLCRALVMVVDFMNGGVSFVASLPGASVDGIRLDVVQLVMVYVLAAAVCLLLRYVRKMCWGRADSEDADMWKGRN